jgi:hypothetical protein
VATQPLRAALRPGAAAYCASPLTVATHACFATPSGDARLLRHAQWRRKPGYMKSAQILWRRKPGYMKSAQILSNKNKLTISYQRRSSSQDLIKQEQAHNIISKKIKLTRSYIIYDHIKQEQAHNIIHHLSYMIISKKIKLTISFIIYDHIKKDQAHNIIYHI